MFLKYSLYFAILHVAMCQLLPNFYLTEKSGQCPPYPNIGVCSMTCFADGECPSNLKCCRTACGGTYCIKTVSSRVQSDISEDEKPGYCPATPTGPWVCSNRCSVDSDCRGTKKCCKNRCGAMACTKSVDFLEDK